MNRDNTIRVTGPTTIQKDKENMYQLCSIANIQECGMMVLKMELEKNNTKMDQYIKVNSSMDLNMEMENYC